MKSYRVFKLKEDFFNYGLEGSIFSQILQNSKFMVLTRANLIYFIKIEETFEQPSYFLQNTSMNKARDTFET